MDRQEKAHEAGGPGVGSRSDSHANYTIHLAFGADPREPKTSNKPQSLAQIEQLFTVHRERADKMGAYVCAPMANGHRCKADAEPCAALFLDFDGKTGPKPDPESSKAFFGDFLHFGYTTFSYTPANGKHRIVMALDRPVTPDEYRELFEYLAEILPFPPDPALNHPDQPVFLPSCPPGAERLSWSNEGRPVPVDEWLAAYRAQRKTQSRAQSAYKPRGDSVITRFNETHDLQVILEQHSYQQRGKRLLWPGSESGIPGVSILAEGRLCYSHHSGDPLADGNPHDAFDVWAILEYGGDKRKAVKEAARLGGLDAHSRIPPGETGENPRQPAEDGYMDSLMAEAEGRDAVGKMDENQKRAVLERLAGLDLVTYAIEKGPAAKALGLHPIDIDKAVAHIRAEMVHHAAKYNPPQIPWVTSEELTNARLAPICFVENYLWADLGLVVAPGGVGKTTLLIYEAVHIALGLPLYGLRIKRQGGTVFITAEDSREIFSARLREVMKALDLDEYQCARALERIGIWDISGENIKLAELDGDGNIMLTPLADQIVAAYSGKNIAQIVLDPAVSFGPGERLVNDSEQAIVTACRRIVRGLNCAVRIIHHSGKANARALSTDQYTSRGGTAMPDGSRMVVVLTVPDETDKLVPPPEFKRAPGRSVFLLSRAKLSYAPPQSQIWICREGYRFDFMTGAGRPSAQEKARTDAETLLAFIGKELEAGRRHSANTLEDAAKTELDIPKARVSSALASLFSEGRVCRTPLPEDERRGGRKDYINFPESPRGSEGKNDPQAPSANFPKTTSPPYKEWGSGEVDPSPLPIPPHALLGEVRGSGEVSHGCDDAEVF